jgi:hypothetical protein
LWSSQGKQKDFYVHKGMLESLGAYKVKIYWSMGFKTHEVECGIPYSHRCTLLVVGALLAQNITRKTNQPVVYASRLLNSGE